MATYEIKRAMPFVRAHINAYGASEPEAAAALKGLLDDLRSKLPKDCTVWEPEYKGSAEGLHCSTVVITLGDDKEEAEALIAQKAQKVGS